MCRRSMTSCAEMSLEEVHQQRVRYRRGEVSNWRGTSFRALGMLSPLLHMCRAVHVHMHVGWCVHMHAGMSSAAHELVYRMRKIFMGCACTSQTQAQGLAHAHNLPVLALSMLSVGSLAILACGSAPTPPLPSLRGQVCWRQSNSISVFAAGPSLPEALSGASSPPRVPSMRKSTSLSPSDPNNIAGAISVSPAPRRASSGLSDKAIPRRSSTAGDTIPANRSSAAGDAAPARRSSTAGDATSSRRSSAGGGSIVPARRPRSSLGGDGMTPQRSSLDGGEASVLRISSGVKVNMMYRGQLCMMCCSEAYVCKKGLAQRLPVSMHTWMYNLMDTSP